MSIGTIPHQQTVLDELQDLTYHLYQILDVAAQKSREFFVQEGQELDLYLYPNLVRYYTKQALLEGKAGVAYTVQDLENNGLYLVYRHYHIKILKSSHGALPPAGPSRIKQGFYCQNTLWHLHDLPPMKGQEYRKRSALNLVILWDCDRHSKLLQLRLACPKHGSISQAVAHWIGTIQHPAYTLGEQTSAAAYTDEMDDLDISLPTNSSDTTHLA